MPSVCGMYDTTFLHFNSINRLQDRKPKQRSRDYDTNASIAIMEIIFCNVVVKYHDTNLNPSIYMDKLL